MGSIGSTGDDAVIDLRANRPLRVVIADDNSDIRFVLRVNLDLDGGFDVVSETTTALEALDIVGDAQPDILLLDLLLPDMFGVGVIPLVRAVAPFTGIVVVSAVDRDQLQSLSVSASADAFVSKGDLCMVGDVLRAVHAGLRPSPLA